MDLEWLRSYLVTGAIAFINEKKAKESTIQWYVTKECNRTTSISYL